MNTLKRKALHLVFGSLVVTAAPLLSGVANASDKGRESIDVDIREWNLTLSKEKVRAGNVGFAVKNKGKETHELAIIKLNNNMMTATGRFPVDKHGHIDEDRMDFGQIVGEIEEIKSGDNPKQLFKLEPGRYAIICNMLEQEPDGSMEAHF